MEIIYSNNKMFETWWSRIIQNDILQYPLYSKLEISYQKLYNENYQFEDLSFIIIENKQPIVGLIVSKHINNDNICEFTGFGRPVYYIENKKIENTLLNGARKKIKKVISGYFSECKSFKLSYTDFLNNNKLSFLGDFLLAEGAHQVPSFSQIISLNQNETLLHQGLRKRYRSFINWGKNNLKIKILNSENIAEKDIEMFRSLHIQEAGRETRSRYSWLKQFEMVKERQAFIVFGFWENDLVTAAFFSFSKKSCYYGVGASIRAMFDKPLSHIILWNTILYAKKLGCEYFEIGEILFPKINPLPPTSKELGISTFKRGFGGETNIRLNIELEITKTL